MTEFSVKDIKEQDIGELYNKVKLSEETMKEILSIGEEKFESFCNEKFRTVEEKEEEEESSNNLRECYLDTIYVLKKYCDLKEEYYPIIALWIIGTYYHEHFPSFPYLFINAMKGSGKSRLLRLIVHLSKEGSMLNSLTEAVLFRTKGTLGIDEFEGAVRKGNEPLKELLNSAYKKGTKVKRMVKRKTLAGDEQVVEEFDVYRPICLANIYGMETVLNDRCLNIILDKSIDSRIVNMIEIYDLDDTIIKLKQKQHYLVKAEILTPQGLKGEVNVVSVNVVVLQNIYKLWNIYINTNNTNDIKNINNTNNIVKMFDKIRKTGIKGRDLELTFPLFILADKIGILNEITENLKNLIKERQEEDAVENTDITLLDFISQETNPHFQLLNNITKNFREYLKSDEEWINPKWMGRALKRLNVIIDKKRTSQGLEIKLNIEKAQEKMKMFK